MARRQSVGSIASKALLDDAKNYDYLAKEEDSDDNDDGRECMLSKVLAVFLIIAFCGFIYFVSFYALHRSGSGQALSSRPYFEPNP